MWGTNHVVFYFPLQNSSSHITEWLHSACTSLLRHWQGAHTLIGDILIEMYVQVMDSAQSKDLEEITQGRVVSADNIKTQNISLRL